jgi:uncharacterized protein YebE (UPF0316 family)
MWLPLALFFAGAVEDMLHTWSVRAVSKGYKWLAGLLNFIYVLVWYVAIVAIVSSVNSLWLAFFYAVGSGFGAYAYLELQEVIDKRRNKSK